MQGESSPLEFFVNEDLAQETLEKREEQRPMFEEAIRNGKIAYFVLERLVIKDRNDRPAKLSSCVVLCLSFSIIFIVRIYIFIIYYPWLRFLITLYLLML